jgi:hypothetical protein
MTDTALKVELIERIAKFRAKEVFAAKTRKPAR